MPFTLSRSVRTALLFLLSIGLLLSCQSKTTVRLGFSSSLTGRGASLGKDLYEGALFAVQEINQGKGPFRIELIVRDDAGLPAKAIANILEFAEKGVEVTMGIATSSLAREVLPVIEENRMVLLGASISSPFFDNKEDALFRVVPSSIHEARAVADYAIHTLGPVLFLGLLDEGNSAYAVPWFQAFKERFEQGGGRVLSPVPFRSQISPVYPDVIERALRLLRNQKEEKIGLCVVASSSDTAALAQEFRKKYPEGALAISGWASNYDFLKFGGKAVEGTILAQTYNPTDTSPHYLIFKQAFQDSFGRLPSFGVAQAYEAVKYLEAALHVRKRGESIRQALPRVKEIQGVQRTIRFDPTGDAYRSIFVFTVRSGEFVFVSEREPELK